MLFEGGEHSYSGLHLELANAEIYDLPERPPRIVVAAGGEEAARLAAEKADGLVGVEPDPKLVRAFQKAGGKGETYAECGICWAANEKKALETLHRYHRWGVLGWSVLAELPRPQSFEEATEKIEPADLRESIPCGPDPAAYLRRIDEFLDAGFDNVILMQVGPDQGGFFKFFEKELASELQARAEREPAGARR
jgi:G6PDH family F420-dependent oxidoreductase